jgi:hypothetical protein
MLEIDAYAAYGLYTHIAQLSSRLALQLDKYFCGHHDTL